MSESDGGEAFHAAIWQSPDDDLPRLVYADWLDERNEPDAAAFLRLLCAVRTCPPDVDRLRPLVADFRRAMAKMPAAWIDAVCPVPPAVVVGPWVDVDHEANRGVLEHLRTYWRWNWKRFAGVRPPPAASLSWTLDPVSQRLWHDLAPVLGPAAACGVGGPALVDVWSGMVLAATIGDMEYVVRAPPSQAGTLPTILRSRARADDEVFWVGLANTLGPGWIPGEECFSDEIEIVRKAAAEFDPANQPG